MIEYAEFGWRIVVIAGICIFTWSVTSSLEKIARAVGKIASQSKEVEDQ